jgi:prepilin-type N-terminal cleavage/methylation domain-containing protein
VKRSARFREASTPWKHCAPSSDGSVDGGYTLIELIIVTAVLPIVIGGIAVALVSVFSLQGSVTNRLSDSGDAQVVSASFESDVQSASFITAPLAPTKGVLQTPPQNPVPCETTAQSTSTLTTEVLGLEWGTGKTEVSYLDAPQGSSYNLLRNFCQKGSTVPVSSVVVSRDVSFGQTATVTCSTLASTQCTGTTNYKNSWISAAGVTGVTFNITEPGSNYTYSLTALPGASSPSNDQSQVNSANSSCGFATPGTGTYASSLCFVDLSPYSQTPVACPQSPSLQEISAPISNTPYTMTFCLGVSGASVSPHAIPTYFAPPTSEAFLGNNGFYTGIPGTPALYQTGSGTTTVTITNIQVLDSNGNPASGWELVTGDAESTDGGESITWTSDKVLNGLPNTNSATAPYGNACAAPSFPGGVDLTGLGTTTVTCAATVDSDKTGTVMLEAGTPSSLTVTMVGTGLQAIFIGLLL